MKSIYPKILLLVLGTVILPGCIAFPPLIQVEHKHDAPANSQDEVIKRLDAIDQRLNELEKAPQTH